MASIFLNGEPRFRNKYYNEIIRLGYTPLEDINTVKGKYYIQDSDGYVYYTSIIILRRGFGSNKFHSNNKYTIQNLKKYIELQGLKYLVLSDEYINHDTPIKFYCEEHGEFEKKLTHFVYKKYYCPHCSTLGKYSINIADENEMLWKTINSKVYFIEFFDDNEHFYKIGVTTKKVNQRFSGVKQIYNYNIIKTIDTNLYDAIYIEKKLHDLNFDNKYIPLKDIRGGHTECFSKIVYDGI